jgi:hypothetical protein
MKYLFYEGRLININYWFRIHFSSHSMLRLRDVTFLLENLISTKTVLYFSNQWFTNFFKSGSLQNFIPADHKIVLKGHL